MLINGYQDKRDQYRDMHLTTSNDINYLIKKGWKQSSPDVVELKRRLKDIEAISDHQQTSNDRCITARNDLVVSVEAYHDAASDYRRSASRHRYALKEANEAPSKTRRAQYEQDARDELPKMRRRAKRAKKFHSDVLEDTTAFAKAINNLSSNVSDLGPHNGVNNPVRDRLHLNADASGSMSPRGARGWPGCRHRAWRGSRWTPPAIWSVPMALACP